MKPKRTIESLAELSADSIGVIVTELEKAKPPEPDVLAQSPPNAHYWHTFVRGVGSGQIYRYRVHGPFEPAKFMRFDGDRSSSILIAARSHFPAIIPAKPFTDRGITVRPR